MFDCIYVSLRILKEKQVTEKGDIAPSVESVEETDSR